MRYQNIVAGKFLSRPNRFIAMVDVDGKIETVHVKNTGRCKELLTENALVYLEKSNNPQRKTKYDLIAVEKGKLLINMDAQAPNRVFAEWAKENVADLSFIKREVTYGDSRFDFYMEAGEKRIFVEVKGVTLEQDGVVMFPDAPTERGVKHLKGLRRAVENGYEAMVVFVVQMEQAHLFCPNQKMHPAFAKELKRAQDQGVAVRALNCKVCPDELSVIGDIEIKI
ncbi:MAG: DNA/RNA nuclease SfsA [Clostridia bacterium]|nr:DNA/RNA nuclease SfsA [Clostridia bacterium]